MGASGTMNRKMPQPPGSHQDGSRDSCWLPTKLLQPVLLRKDGTAQGPRACPPPPKLLGLTSVAGGSRGASQGVRVWKVAWRVLAHRLAVTSETKARNMDPFLPLGTTGLARACPASRAMSGPEPGVGCGVGSR